VHLFGPDGQAVKLKRGKRISEMESDFRAALMIGEIEQIGHIAIPDIFALTTNGQHQITILGKVTTNIFGRGKVTYFSIPSVTNSFFISTIPKP
jgi:hypothetical protein